MLVATVMMSMSIFATETADVVYIGDTGYATLAEAVAAANDMTAATEVTIEIHGKTEYTAETENLTGAYTKINFVGMTADAEISITRNGYGGYISGAGSTPSVSFTELTLSKPTGGYANDAGYMNSFFTVYRVKEVSYTDCYFPGGACAAGCTTTYTGCTFENSDSDGKYSLWVYGNADCTVADSTFAADRGIKMYTEGHVKDNSLTVTGTTFENVTAKPAIVLTYGESVTLEENTYSSTGVFELDVDGDPNGTTVTADITDIACKNDNYTDCGVLVDGKIYTTITDAAADITSESTVTVMYTTAETVELPAGTTLTVTEGNTAENVTIAAPAAAGDIRIGYITDNFNNQGYSAVFGEAYGVVAEKSFVVKMYSGEALVGTAALNDPGKVLLNGVSKTISWHAPLADDGDTWWITEWTNGALNVNALPDKVELHVDGVKVSEGVVKMNSSDDACPIIAAVTDSEGKIIDFVAAGGYVNNVRVGTKLNDAIAAAKDGETVTLLADVAISEKLTLNAAGTITVDGNGHTIKSAEDFVSGDCAIMLGGTGTDWDDTKTADHVYTIKNITFEGFTGGALLRAQGVTLNMESCIVSGNAQTGTTYALIHLDYTEAALTNVTFEKNTSAYTLISHNAYANDSVTNLTISGCTFEGNTSGNVGMIEDYTGKLTATGNAFVGNTASGALIYTATSSEITGNYFAENTFSGTNANKAAVLAGPWVEGEYTITITDNAFVGEDFPGAYVEGWAEYGAVSSYDLSSNYWNGGEPNYGTNNDSVDVTIDSYYTTVNYENGELKLSDEVSVTYVAQIGNTKYETLADAFANATKGATVTLLDNVTVSEQILIEDNDVLSDITFDGNGFTVYDAVSGASTLCFGSNGYWATGVKINNLTVEAAEGNTDPYCAIRLYGGTSSVLTGVVVRGDYTYGINFYGTHGATLDNCQIVSAWANGQDEYPLMLTNGSTIETLWANDSEQADGAKIFIDSTSSITTLYADEHTEMIDVNSMDKIGTIVEMDTQVPMVAEVNGVQYATLADAFAVAQDDKTVTLLDNVTLDTMITISGTVTLDLNGYSITACDNWSNGSGNESVFCVAYGGDLTINDSADVDGTIDGTKAYSAVKMTYTGDNAENGIAKLTVNGGNLVGNYYAVVGNGSRNGTEITVNGGLLQGTNSVVSLGIFNPQNGTVTINGGKLSGTVGIEMRSGTLNMTGGTVESVYDGELTTTKNASGSTVYGGAAVVLSQHTTNNPVAINITGGMLSGQYAFYQNRLIPEYTPSTNISATITADVILDGIVAAVEEGYEMPAADDGSYTLEAVVEKFNFCSNNMTLGSSLAMTFYLDPANLEEGETYTAVITKEYADGRANAVVEIPYADWIDYYSWKAITFNGIAAKEMTDNISIEVFDGNGVSVSECWTTTVEEYALSAFDDESATEELRTVLVDMLNYGAAAQVYFEYNTADLANADLTAEHLACASTSTSAWADTTVFDNTYFYGNGLYLKDTINLALYFHNIGTATHATITYTNHYGTTDYSYDVEFTQDGSLKEVKIGTLAVADANTVVTCELKDADGNVITTVKDSIASCVAYAMTLDSTKADANLMAVYNAINKFATSAYAYFH